MAGSRSISLLDWAALKRAVIAGDEAGDHTVSGIDTGDALLAVGYFAGAGSDVTDFADLTDEFAITAEDTINNAEGADTTGGKLWVWWIDKSV